MLSATLANKYFFCCALDTVLAFGSSGDEMAATVVSSLSISQITVTATACIASLPTSYNNNFTWQCYLALDFGCFEL